MFGGYYLGFLYLGESDYQTSGAVIYNPTDLENEFIDYVPESIPISQYAVEQIDDSGNYGVES